MCFLLNCMMSMVRDNALKGAIYQSNNVIMADVIVDNVGGHVCSAPCCFHVFVVVAIAVPPAAPRCGRRSRDTKASSLWLCIKV